MNDLDLAIVATLRAEAREAEMRTDTPQQYELLSSRLDAVDRSRTRTRWLAVAAAVVLVGGAAWAVTSTQQASTAPPATTPSPTDMPDGVREGMTYTAANMDPVTRMVLPAWTASTDIDWKSRQGAQFVEGQCAEPLGAPACSSSDDLKLRLESLVAYYPASGDAAAVVGPTADDFVGNLVELERQGAVTLSTSFETQVGGLPATVRWFSVLENVPGAMGCPTRQSTAAECFPLVAGRDVRLAVVGHGPATPPTLLYLSLNTDAADKAERFAEFDAMLATVEFG